VRKLVFAMLVAVMLAALSVSSMPAVAAQDDEPEPLRCTFEMSIDLSVTDPHWQGTVAGDIEGDIHLWERWSDNYVVGATEHFFEDLVIVTDQGDIKGWDKGVWNFATFKFRAMGWITETTTEDLSDLVGYKMIMQGFTSEFPPTPPSTVVTASGTMMIVPP